MTRPQAGLSARYGGSAHPSPRAATGWSVQRIFGPSAVVGSNGLSQSPDGEVYIAQAYGSEISALRLPDSGSAPQLRVVIANDDPIVSPDDVAFGAQGEVFATEIAVGRVGVRYADGNFGTVDDDVPAANGIATRGSRLFVGEFRAKGRIFELFPSGAPRRTVVEQIDYPNGMSIDGAGQMYFPSVLAGEIWRVGIDGGPAEKVIEGLHFPTAVKCREDGSLWATQATGEIVRIDPRTRTFATAAQLPIGNDNLLITADNRIIVSNYVSGLICELQPDGTVDELLAPGLIGPLGLATDAGGNVFAADGWSYVVITPQGDLRRPAFRHTPGFPGLVRSVTLGHDGTPIFANTQGDIVRYQPGSAEPLASGLGYVVGMCVTPGGNVLVAEVGSGSLLEIGPQGVVTSVASGLRHPTGIAWSRHGVVVAESTAGRVLLVDGERRRILGEGLQQPHGVAVHDGWAYVLDRMGRSLHRYHLNEPHAETIATDLPTGPGRQLVEQPVPGFDAVPGPWSPFAGLTADREGRLYLSADGDGSVFRVEPAETRQP